MAAPVVANATGMGDTRYDISGLSWDSARGAYVDDEGWHYDTNGLSLDRPNAYDPSKPGQDMFDESTGTYSFGGGGGGSNPMDAYTRQLQSFLESQSAGQRADTRAAIQQALIGYGVVPEGFKDEFGALDPTTLALIQKNTDTGISGYARMLQEKQDAQRQMLAALSGKGLRRSGAKGFLGRRAQLDWDRKSADATAALLQNVGGLKKSFADAESQRKLQLMQALFSQQYSPSAAYNQFQATQPRQQTPQDLRQGAINYWQGQQTNPTPTGYLPSGQAWYGGVNGYEATPFRGKALDSLMG